MGMSLTGNTGGYFQFNMFAWGHALRLAEMHGWQPSGTLAPQDEEEEEEDEEPRSYREWDPENYITNDGLQVTDDDVRNLADALEAALDDIPTHDALEHKTIQINAPDGEKLRAIPSDVEVSPMEY